MFIPPVNLQNTSLMASLPSDDPLDKLYQFKQYKAETIVRGFYWDGSTDGIPKWFKELADPADSKHLCEISVDLAGTPSSIKLIHWSRIERKSISQPSDTIIPSVRIPMESVSKDNYIFMVVSGNGVDGFGELYAMPQSTFEMMFREYKREITGSAIRSSNESA